MQLLLAEQQSQQSIWLSLALSLGLSGPLSLVPIVDDAMM